MRVLRGIFALTLVAAFLVAIGFTPRSVLADEVTVQGATCTAGQLETAIADAGDNGIVRFNCTNPTIVFSSWENQITISTTVTIDGNNGGNQSIILDGSDATNFFVVGDRGEQTLEPGNLTVEHMTFQNGNTHNTDEYDGGERVFTSTNEGGAIDVEGNSSLTVIASNFFSNYADGYGGAIDSNNLGASLTIRGSIFAENESGLDGGAIENWGTLVISQSSFVNNSASNLGGAVDLYEGTTEINSTTFSGNQAPIGSAINVDDRDGDEIPTLITWSTIYQTGGTAPSIFFDSPVNLEGVLLGGGGEHCEFDGFNGTLSGSNNLANDGSCVPDSNEPWEGQTLMLGFLTPAFVNGVALGYHPLMAGSPAIDGGPASCDTDIQPGPDADEIGNTRPNGNGLCDIGAIESNPVLGVPSTLCASQWTGQLRMIDDGGDCGRTETFIELPQDGPLSLCVNQWNGSTSMGDDCSRSEYQLVVTGDGSIDVCVNDWNGSLRVSDRCSRSEHADVL